MKPTEVVDTVRDQYEGYPYPDRNPQDELQRLYMPIGGSHIEEIVHYCFRGKKPIADFRALVAGAGTGDTVIHLAEQLRDVAGAKVIYFDMSQSSMDIARERARLRSLYNIDWVLGSILDLPNLDIEPVDFINCSGVLHHLPDPDEGLRCLGSVLKPEGGMYIMVYATYGRHAIYHAQDLYRDLIPDDIDVQSKIKLARRWLDAFPDISFMKANLHRWEQELSTDAGFLDMLLHYQDRSYTVDEVYDFAESNGFDFGGFVTRVAHVYKLESAISDPVLLDSMSGKSLREKQSLAERLNCNIPIHCFYVNRIGSGCADLEDDNNTIVLAMEMTGQADQLRAAVVPGRMLELRFSAELQLSLKATEATRIAFEAIDTNLPLGKVRDKMRAELPNITEDQINQAIFGLFGPFNELGMMFLKDASLPKYPQTHYGRLDLR